jgi:hypothetical protein
LHDVRSGDLGARGTTFHHIGFSVSFIIVTACCQVSLHFIAEVRSAFLVEDEISRIFMKPRHNESGCQDDSCNSVLSEMKWAIHLLLRNETKHIAVYAVPFMFDDLMGIYGTPDTNAVVADFAT